MNGSSHTHGDATAAAPWRTRMMEDNEFLTTGSDIVFDGFVRAVGAALSVPMAMIAFEQDDHWLVRASVGPVPERLSRLQSPCTVVVETGDYLAVRDIAADRRFESLESGPRHAPFRGYAGVPIALRGGRILGCLAAMDGVPRVFNEGERTLLEALGAAVAASIERRLGLPTIVRTKALLLSNALEHTDDAVRVFRLEDGCIVDVTYQNRAALAAPSVSMVELAEALDDEDGEVFRAGAHDGSLVEMQARRFEILDQTYAVTIERDVTQHERVEQAYDEAAIAARLQADRYADLAMLAAVDAPFSERRIRLVLDFLLREFRMGTAAFAIRSDGRQRLWEAQGNAALQAPIPREFIDAALAVRTSVRHVQLGEPATAARFSGESLVGSGSYSVAICLGRAHAPARDAAAPLDGEILRRCMLIAAGDAIMPSDGSHHRWRALLSRTSQDSQARL